jgi:predicted transcriptional regulator
MKISEFLEETGMRPSHFCNKVGISSTSLYSFIAGETSPRLKHAISIYNFTNKKVTYEDMLNENLDGEKIKKRKERNKKQNKQITE